MLLTTLLLLACAQGDSAAESRLVPQYGLGRLVAEWRGRPMLRIGGVLDHVLQIHALRGPGLRWQIEFPGRILGTAWDADEDRAWVATGEGVHRVDARTGRRTLAQPGWGGALALHPERPWLGLLGRDHDSSATGLHDGSLRVLDLESGAWLVEAPIPIHRHAALRWRGETLHGTGSGGRGYLSRSGRGTIRWVHVSLDPTAGGSRVVEERSFASRFESGEADELGFGPEESEALAWKHPRGTGPRDSTRNALRADADAIELATSGIYAGHRRRLRVRLTKGGHVELIHLPWEQAARFLGPLRHLDHEAPLPGFQSRIESGMCEVFERSPHAPGFALLHDFEEGSLSRHGWDPRSGVLEARWSRPIPFEEPSARPVVADARRERILILPAHFPREPILVLDLDDGEELARIHGPASAGDGAAGRAAYAQWSVDGHRVLVVSGAQVSVYELDSASWIHHRPRVDHEDYAFAIPGGWLIRSATAGRVLGQRGALVDVPGLPPVLELHPDPERRFAIAALQDGRALLLDLDDRSVAHRWVDSGWNTRGAPGWRPPASLWSPNGRYLLRSVGQAGRVRAVDPATGAVHLEWQPILLEDGGAGWLAWTPEGAWNGSRDARGELLRAHPDGRTAPLGRDDSGRDAAEIRSRISALFAQGG